MSFDINKENPPHTNIKLSLAIDVQPIKYIQSRDPEYIKYLYHGSEKSPIIRINNTSYINHSLYIWKGKIHPIQWLDYDGELIIECLTSSGNTKCFICFLLKQDSTVKPTEIDKLWKASGESIITKLGNESTAIYYKNGIDTVIVFTDTIPINEDLRTSLPYPRCYLFPNYIENYRIINNNVPTTDTTTTSKIKEGFDMIGIDQYNQFFQETLSGDLANGASIADGSETFNIAKLNDAGLYLDCAPTSQSTEQLKAITIPLDEQGNVNLSSALQLSATMTALIILTITGFLFMSIPTMYKSTVIKLIEMTTVPDKATRLKTVNYFIFIIWFIFALALLMDGFSNGNIYEGYAGLVSFFIVLVSTIILIYKQKYPEYSFPLVYNWNVADVGLWFKEIYTYYTDYSAGINTAFGAYLVLIVLVFILPILVSSKKILPTTDTQTRVFGVVFGFGIAYSFIFAFFSHYLLLKYSVVAS